MKYMGEHIFGCESAEHYGKWIVLAHHQPTGMPLADELCPHFHTITEARQAIKEELAYRKAIKIGDR